MRDKFIVTESVGKAVVMVKSLLEKASRIDRIGLLYGKPGFGKSSFIDWYCSNYPSFYVRAVAVWTRSLCAMLEDCLRAFRVEPSGKVKHDFREFIRVLRKHNMPCFFDEADRIVRKSILIESLRDIADLSRVPIILVGQEGIYNSLQRNDLGNFFSRITESVEFLPLSARDVQTVAKELCDLKCDGDVAALIRTICLGDFRLVNALLMRLEKLCSLNSKSELTIRMVREAAKAMPNPENFAELDGEPSRQERTQVRAVA